MSSPHPALGSWVPIPIKAWMSVTVYSVFVLGSGLATGVLPSVFIHSLIDGSTALYWALASSSVP
jgi:hypothetical protein